MTINPQYANKPGYNSDGIKLTSPLDMDPRGNYPSTWFLEWSGNAGAGDNTVIYISADVSAYNFHTFTVSGTNSADVEVSHDGITWEVAAVELTTSLTGTKVVTIPTGSTGVLRGKFKFIRINQDGSTDSNAVGAHSVE